MPWRSAALPPLVGLLLVACGGDDDSDATGDLERFCEISASPEPSDAFRLAFEDPTDRAAVQAFDELLAETERVAPPDVGGEVSAYRTSSQDVLAELAAGRSEPSAQGEPAQARMNEAGEAITRYVDEHCF